MFPGWYPDSSYIRVSGVFSVVVLWCLLAILTIRHLSISFFDELGVF